MIIFHPDGTLPNDDSIFVFGSNLAGIHGAGAALIARKYYGAKIGFGIGLHGRSYAIPTKDENIKTLEINKIRPFVEDFIKFTKQNPDKRFFITRIGCGLAGYKDGDIAPMFKGAINCSFPEEWRLYIEHK